MGDFFDKVEGWFMAPVNSRLSPALLVVLTVLITVAFVWSVDTIGIIKKGLAQ